MRSPLVRRVILIAAVVESPVPRFAGAIGITAVERWGLALSVQPTAGAGVGASKPGPTVKRSNGLSPRARSLARRSVISSSSIRRPTKQAIRARSQSHHSAYTGRSMPSSGSLRGVAGAARRPTLFPQLFPIPDPGRHPVWRRESELMREHTHLPARVGFVRKHVAQHFRTNRPRDVNATLTSRAARGDGGAVATGCESSPWAVVAARDAEAATTALRIHNLIADADLRPRTWTAPILLRRHVRGE
jgi:hypothetical protein